MMRVALTGSIAMGKSEAARMFAAAGVPVFDSDDAVHQLYSSTGAAVAPIADLLPGAVKDGVVHRPALTEAIRKEHGLLAKIEAVVHPLVHDMQRRFIDACTTSGAPFVVLDIPLLFETGRQGDVDKIVVVSCPAAEQRRRALARPGMTEEKLELILSRQVPDIEKRARADYVIDTSGSLVETARSVEHVIAKILIELEQSANA